MAKYALVFSEYVTTCRVIEADSLEQANLIAQNLVEEYDFTADLRDDMERQESEISFEEAFKLDDFTYDPSDYDELSAEDINDFLGVDDYIESFPTITYSCGCWDEAFGAYDTIDEGFDTKKDAMSYCENNELDWSGKSGEWVNHSDSEWHMLVDGKPVYWVRKVEE